MYSAANKKSFLNKTFWRLTFSEPEVRATKVFSLSAPI